MVRKLPSGKGPGGAGHQLVEDEPAVPRRVNGILTWISSGVANRIKKVILCLCSKLMRPQLECCVHFWDIQFRNDTGVLECVQRRVMELVKCQEYKSS